MKKTILLFIMLFALNVIYAQTQTEMWGVTSSGGFASGLIYKTDGNGENQQLVKILNDFPGEYPVYLCKASNGKIYGVTHNGGILNSGFLYEYDPFTNIYTVKYDFNIQKYGGNTGKLIQASNGKLYGTTGGGNYNSGIIYEYDIQTNTLTKKYDFNGTTDGGGPCGGLVQASNGKLYGLTNAGGSANQGVLFEYDPVNGIYSTKHDFIIKTNGANPLGGLIQASNGKLYGMTSMGGNNYFGVLFEYNIITNIYTKKLDFDGATNGKQPRGDLMQASNGNLYGMTSLGGTNGYGVLFEYNITTSKYSKKLDFNGSIYGRNPQGSLLQASNGMLYGMTGAGGKSAKGTAFEYNPVSNTITKIIDFNGDSLGEAPLGTFIELSNGILYGVTSDGGILGVGVMIKYDITNKLCTKKFDFNSSPSGKAPNNNLMKATNGKLYGVASEGGNSGYGVLYEYDIYSYTYTKKLDFNGSGNGSYPYCDLIQASNGKLYGTASSGGTWNYGVLFEYDIDSNTYTKKIVFNGTVNGNGPGTLIQASNGSLYGTTGFGGSYNQGVLYEFDPSSNFYTKKFEFNTQKYGGNPGKLIQASNGKLYGTTINGDSNYFGVLFEFDIITNTYFIKHKFSTPNNGKYPYYGIMQASNGKLYGMTNKGGTYDYGTIYEYDISINKYNKILDFDGVNGKNPDGVLFQAANGKLYGVTPYGGINDKGVLFEFNPDNNTYVKKMDFNYYNGFKAFFSQFIEFCRQPVFSTSNNDVRACIGLNTMIMSPAVGNGLTWQWQVDDGSGFKNLSNNSVYSNVNNDTLNITGVKSTMNNYKYRCIVTSTCPVDTIISDTTFLSVASIPNTSLTLSDVTSFCKGDSVMIKASTDPGLSYQWKKDNNLIPGANQSSYTATQSGSYSVIVTNSNICSQTSSPIAVFVYPLSADFTINDSAQCLKNNSFIFTNSSNGQNSNNWNFGDATFSTLASPPAKEYTTTGAKIVKLITGNNYGCKDSISKTVIISPNPLVNLGKDTTINSKQSITLNAGNGFDNYLWSTNDTSNQITVDFSIYGLGTKQFWVKITKNDCDAFDTINVTIIKYNSINDFKTSFEARVYPNPVNSEVVIDFSSIGKEMIIVLTDLNGKSIKSIKINPVPSKYKYTIDVSELANGVYFLNISNNEINKFTKIVKY